MDLEALFDEEAPENPELNWKDDTVYNRFLKQFNKPVYEDVTAMINSTVPTLIDGDALLLYSVLQDSHPIIAGNQFLHIAYLFERYLDLLIQKGTTCILVFNGFWELVWEKNLPVRTLRSAIYKHFKNNTNIPTYCFPWYYSPSFVQFKLKEKPRCIISSLNFDKNFESFNEKLNNTKYSLNLDRVKKLFATSLIYCLATDLPIIDIDSINIGVTLIYAFHLSSKRFPRKVIDKFEEECINELPLYRAICPKKVELSVDIKSSRDLIIEAGALYFRKFKDQNGLKFLFLYYAVQFTLPLENRAPPTNWSSNKGNIKTMQDFINKWHECLLVIIEKTKKQTQDFDYKSIVDLWQGTLFMCVLNLTTYTIENSTNLGGLHIEYESLLADMNTKLEEIDQINPYPIQPIFKQQFLIYQESENPTEMIQLNKVDNPLINKFCGDMFEEIFWENPANVLNIKHHKETRHWHSRKPIDETPLQYVKQRPMNPKEDREHQKSFRYSHIYGQNLEGKTTQYDSIIYKDPKKIRNKTEKKQSDSSKKLQEKIKLENEKKSLEKDNEEIQTFKEKMNTRGDIIKLTDDLYYISKIIDRMSCPETIIKSSILKLKILKAIISNKNTENKVNYIKDLLLLIRSLLKRKNVKSGKLDINDKDQKYISKLLHLYGFKDIAERNDLPMDKTFKEEYDYNFVRFQMEHLGANLIVENNSGPFDPDINFAPDKWQVEFIEAIRRNESALVVAPTSSGKTFASYYCMKRVLQYSRDGIVIYVAPTKALVNQVAATVTHRFKNTNLPDDGTSVVGIFTRDYRSNPISSRILITVPQCLDILLLSPNHFEWSKKIQYVIFDEVHRLSGNEEGVVWERLLVMIRCPFLALSATISDSHMFFKWLESLQRYKEEQDKLNNCLRGSYKIRCVVHKERHADLIKHVYSEAGLQHYHPYCALHPNILLNSGKIPESVTLSPKETLQLYDILSNCAQQYIPSELDYVNYFKERTEFGFLTRKSVRDYEKELGKVFFKIYEQNAEVFKIVLEKLNPVGYQPQNSRLKVSLDDGKKLLNHMAENNMLPAIVFSYNRKLVEEFSAYLLPETDPNSVDKSRKEIKEEKQLLKRKKNLKDKKKEKKNGEDRFNDEDIYVSLPDAAIDKKRFPINILAKTDSKFKGAGIVDRDDLQFIEARLHHGYLKNMGSKFREVTIAQLQSGIAYHHAGVDKKLRDTAEMLFRIGVVRVVVATGTLAVGVHMPCKSVVIYGDSPFLNSLEFHQMSGRAGRRGFDSEGNVIFLNLTKKRHDMLMTDKLPKMLGNYPISISLVVRLLLLIAGPANDKVPAEEYVHTSLSKALCILENSLLFEIKPHLKQQVKLFIGFALQLLLIQEIITQEGIPTIWSSIIIHLHYHEPANLVFVYLIRSGALAKLVKTTKDDVDLQWKLVVVMAHVFTKVPLTSQYWEEEFKNSVVKLDPLPKCIEDSITNYNQEVKFVFNQYFLSVARHLRSSLGVDNTLPLSKLSFKAKKYNLSEDSHVSLLMNNIRSVCYQREITSAFVALSGNVDSNLDTHQLISNIRHDFCPEVKIVPEHDIDTKLNGYALDFYRHGLPVAINRDNKLRQGMDFALLKDFCLVLKTSVLALEDFQLEGSINARLLTNFQIVRDKYHDLFENGYIFKK